MSQHVCNGWVSPRRCRKLASAGERGMSLWKTLAGAAAGLAADAHLTGHGSIGSLLKGLAERYAFDRHKNDGMPEHQVAFSVGVIALGAKMAKADGMVTRDEVLAFKEVFKVPMGRWRMCHASSISLSRISLATKPMPASSHFC